MRLAIALWLSSPIAIALVLCALNRRTLFGDAADELSTDDPQSLGIGGGADFFEHGQPTTERSRYDHQ